LFTCNPREFGELDAATVDGFCAHPSYRVGLVRAGQPAVLWVSGPDGATPEPGIWMVGRTTGEVRPGTRPRVGLALAALAEPVARATLRADPRTARMEVLRAPQMGNPSVLTPEELTVVAAMVDDWP
jgi:hypothetical protein